MAIQLLAAPLLFAGRIVVGGARLGLRVGFRGGLNRRAVANAVSGSMSINVTSNLPAFAKAVDAFGKNQMPFALHRAINSTAFDVRNHIVEQTYPKSFDVKARQFGKQAFRVERSPNKRKLVARVYDRFKKDYLANQAEGGIKHKRGRYIAIPAQERPRVSGKATYNRTHPRTVLTRPKSFVQSVDGQQMILERRTKNRYPLKRMYLLHESDVQIRKRFPFYEQSQMSTRKRFNAHFTKFFNAAKRSAKRGR